MRKHSSFWWPGLLVLAWLVGVPCLISAATANDPSQPGYSYQNITSTATTTIRSGQGVLHEICINKYGVSGTIAVYDNTAGSGTLIGTITDTATVTSEAPTCVMHDIAFRTGLTIVTGTAAPDITVVYQ